MSNITKTVLFAVELGGTMIGNAALLMLLWKSRQLQRRGSMNLIFNCATVDLTSAMINIPLAMDYFVFKTGNLNGTVPPVAIRYMLTFLFILTLNSALMIMADRLLLVKKTVEYGNMVTVKRSRVAIIITWLSTTVLAVILNIRRFLQHPSHETPIDYMKADSESGGKFFALSTLCIILTLVAVLTRKLYCELQKTQKTTSEDTPKKRAQKKVIVKTSRTALLVMVIYWSCYLPTVINSLLEILQVPMSSYQNLRDFIALFFAQMSSLLNPIVFIARLSAIRQSVLRRLFRPHRIKNLP